MAITVEAEIKERVLVLRLEGELDHHATEQIRPGLLDLMEQHEIQHVVLNMGKLTFMDSSGLGFMLGRFKYIEKRDGSMSVCSISEPVKRLFEMSGLFRIVLLDESETYALQRLGVHQL